MRFYDRLKNWQQKPVGEKFNSVLYNFRALKLKGLIKFMKPDHLHASLPWGKMIVNTDWLGQNIYVGSYEKKELLALKKLVKPGCYAIDIGANIGYYSIYMIKALHCSSVLAFEPSPREMIQLQHNLQLNKCSGVQTFAYALSDHTGYIDLYLAEDNFGKNSIHEISSAGSKVSVPMITLDQFAVEHELLGADLIKMDVEGAEPIVLKGASETIRKFKPVILYESWAFQTAPFGEFKCDATNIILDYGYSLYDISESGKLIKLYPGAIIHSSNLIAIHSEREHEFRSAMII